jgi:membrane protein required for colicin V production
VSALSAVDIALLVAIGMSAFVGLLRGVVREVLSLVVWTASAVVAFAWSARLATRLSPYIEHADARLVAAFALLFLGVLLAGGILSWLIGKVIETSGLSGVDRLLGVVFGALRGGVLCIVAIVMLRPFAAETPWWRSSLVIERLQPFEAFVLDLFDETAAFLRAVSKEL